MSKGRDICIQQRLDLFDREVSWGMLWHTIITCFWVSGTDWCCFKWPLGIIEILNYGFLLQTVGSNCAKVEFVLWLAWPRESIFTKQSLDLLSEFCDLIDHWKGQFFGHKVNLWLLINSTAWCYILLVTWSGFKHGFLHILMEILNYSFQNIQ